MNLSPNLRTVLLALTPEWLSPLQISDRLPKEWGELSRVNQSLKDLVKLGLVQINPVVFGLYRLTSDGAAIKELKLDEKE